MIRVPCEQGSGAWHQARLGIPTASRFEHIITPKTLKPSSQAEGYRNQLLAEWLLGEPLDDGEFTFTERGSAMEADAIAFYELQRNTDVERVGFLTRDDGRCGCSPDGLIGTDGGLELKVPNAATHVGYLLGDAGEKYKAQIQGGLWIAERSYWDFLSYHPSIPSTIVRFQRDEKFIAALASALDAFCDNLAAMKEVLKQRGYEPAEIETPGFFAGVG